MSRTIAIPLAACVACIAGNVAAAAPFTNKTIEIEWVSSGSGHRVDDNKSFTWNNVHRNTIYVSSAGRIFNRRSFYSQGRGGGSEGAEIAPDQQSGNASVRFAGSALVGTMTQPSGAVQFSVSFDPGFTSCTLQVIYGRTSGKQLNLRGPGGGTYAVDSISAGQPTCRISDGNRL